MARDRLTFRQRDLDTALKVVLRRGIKVARIEVRKDGIVIIPGEPIDPAIDPDADPETLAADLAVRNAKV
jgi:hypothetical protein